MKYILRHFAWILKQRFTFESYRWLFFYFLVPSAITTYLLMQDASSADWLAKLFWMETAVIATTPLWAAVSSSIWYMLQMMYYDNIEHYPGYFGKRVEFNELCKAEAQYTAKFGTGFDKDERIVASANLDSHGMAWVVMEPGRHHHCIGYMYMHGANANITQQGFFTNRGRYINREIARALAIATGQCPVPDHERELFSEDLWDTPPYLRDAVIKSTDSK